MLKSIVDQLKLILFSMLSGIMTGMIFDFYRIFRGVGLHNKIITFLEDTLFWILSAIIVFVFLLYTSYAYIGTYVFLYIALGLLLYFKLFSKPLLRLENNVFRSIFKCFRVTINYISYPFQLIWVKLNAKKIKKTKK